MMALKTFETVRLSGAEVETPSDCCFASQYPFN